MRYAEASLVGQGIWAVGASVAHSATSTGVFVRVQERFFCSARVLERRGYVSRTRAERGLDHCCLSDAYAALPSVVDPVGRLD